MTSQPGNPLQRLNDMRRNQFKSSIDNTREPLIEQQIWHGSLKKDFGIHRMKDASAGRDNQP